MKTMTDVTRFVQRVGTGIYDDALHEEFAHKKVSAELSDVSHVSFNRVRGLRIMTDDLPTLAELSTSMGWTRRRPYRATPEAATKLLELLRQRAGMPAIRDALFPMATVKDARRYAIDSADNQMFGDALMSIDGDVARQAVLSLWDMWRIDRKQPHAARMQSLRSLIKLLDDIEVFARRFAR